jgi:multidrug resistance efflux pump
MRRKLLLLVLFLVIAAGGYYVVSARASSLVLTGIVTTNDVIVSAQIPGQLGQLLVKEGDTVTAGQVLAAITPDELRAESAYYAQTAEGAAATVEQNEAALRFEQQQMESQVRQVRAAQAAAESAKQSAEADLENARLTLERHQRLLKTGIISTGEFDQARTAYDALKARVASLGQQADSARAAVDVARANAEQVTLRRRQVQGSKHESAAAAAQRQRADVRLAYTEIKAPIAGIVEVRAARQGEVVTAGQPIVTLINPDDLWVRVDVEETYIDRVRIGDHLTVRLPSGTELDGIVFYRGVDAGFATQRDVSRTKRDVKTFEVRLRVDNRDRRLAVGMTAYVPLDARNLRSALRE